MAKNLKSQWDFGELFPQEAPARRVLSVTELTGTVKRLLEQEIGTVWVAGEMTNFRLQSSGHAYFAIKDAGSQLSCVLFRGDARAVNRQLLHDGQKVVLQGEISVYEARGQYQLRVISVEMQGMGALQIAFEKLKAKLQAEGLFSQDRKRPIPRFPKRLGIVTSISGAALRDVLHVIQARQPALEIIIAACRVQGQGAGDEIADAIDLLNLWHAGAGQQSDQALDLILLTRGGGSLEDLWAFNEEAVARAIHRSRLPVVSAVGHEIDFTISDFVADVRAATPSVAAEMITQAAFASRDYLAEARKRLAAFTARELQRRRDEFGSWNQRLARAHPRKRLQEKAQLLDDLQDALRRGARNHLRTPSQHWLRAQQRLALLRPSQILSRRRDRVQQHQRSLLAQARRLWQRWQHRWSSAEARLRLLSPLHVLDRGFSITMDAATGKLIRTAADVQTGQKLKTRLRSDEIRSVVCE